MSDDRPTQDPPAMHPQWWLADGAENCLLCTGPIHAEAMVYCTGCDCELCQQCVIQVIESGGWLCVDCAQAGSTAGRGERD